MKKIIKKIAKIFGILILLFCITIGIGVFFFGPGTQDYEYDVGTGYQLNRSSAHQITISPKLEYLEGDYNADSIPTKVIELAWNERYVIAKQFGMKSRSPNNPDDLYEEVDKTKTYYWILDTLDKKRYGPFDLADFKEQLKIYELENLELKPVESYKTNK